MKTLRRLQWHYDAIVNGGSTVLECIKLELGIQD